MKKLFIIPIVLFIVYACNSDKKAKLEKLKLDYQKLGEEIKSLEKELNVKDTVMTNVLPAQYKEMVPDTFKTYVEVQGSIDGEDNIIVTSKTVGVISKVLVKEGEAVHKGQLLAQLDAGALEQTLKEMQTSYEFLSDLFDKQKRLWEQKIGSEVQYLTAKNNKESMEIRIKSLREQLDMYNITSPIDGTVEEVAIKVGQNMAPGLIAFRIVNFAKVKVVAEVSDAYAASIKKGNDVEVYFPNEQITIKGKLDFASKFINPTNRNFKVETYISNKNIEFRANMVVLLRIINYSNPHAYILPVNVVLNENGKNYVWVAKPKGNQFEAQKVEVKTGKTYNANVEILEGLNTGDKVLTSNIFNLRNGDIVKL
ncbi:MAG: efflux RND transporter periplasmic adaptor subunit [Bacteroidales bacterium]